MAPSAWRRSESPARFANPTPRSPAAHGPLARGRGSAGRRGQGYFFELLFVKLGALDIAVRAAEQIVSILLRQIPYHLSRRAQHEHAVGNFLPLGDQRVC